MTTLRYLALVGVVGAVVFAFGAPPEARLTQQLGGKATALAMLGTSALVAQGRYLHVIDLTSPVYPKLLTTLSFRSMIRDLVVRDHFVLVILETDGAVLDLSEPSAPQFVSHPYGTFFHGVLTKDLVIGIGDQSLHVFELIPRSPAKRPERLAYVYDRELRGAKLAAMRGTDLILVDDAGVHVYDLSTPSKPAVKARGKLLEAPRGRDWLRPVLGAIVGDHLYVYSVSEVFAYSIADPSRPELLARQKFTRVVDIRVEQDGSLLIFTEGYSATWVDPKRPFAVLRQGIVPVMVGEGVAALSYMDWICVLTAEHGLRMFPKDRVQPWLPPALAPTLPPSPAAVSPRHMGVSDPNPAYDVVHILGHLFVAGGERGLLWFSISGSELKKLGEIPIPEGAAYGMALSGHWLYLAAGQAGLWAVDVRAPGAPTVRAKLPLPGIARAVSISGDLAFVAAGPAGAQVVDIRDPLRPRLRAQIPLPGYVWHIDVHGTKLFVAAGHEGLHVLDVSHPDKPVLLGTVPLPGTAYSVSVGGGYAFVALGFAGLGVVDVQRPGAPKFVTQLPLPGVAFRVRSLQGLLWVTTEWGGVRILNVEDPLHPREVGYERIPGGGWAKAVTLAEGYLYVVGTGVHAIRLAARPEKTVFHIPMENAVFLPPGLVQEVAIVGDWLYAIDGAGITVFTLKDPARPAMHMFLPHPVWPGSVHPKRAIVHGHHLFVLSLQHLLVWNVQDPSRPEFVTSLPLPLPEAGRDMVVAGAHLYISTGEALLAVNIASPERPFFASRTPTTTRIGDLVVARDHLFVEAMDPWGIRIYRIVGPGQVQLEGFYRTDPYSARLGTHVGHYLIVNLQGITVLDISDPARPKEVSRYPPGAFAPERMLAYEQWLFVGVGMGIGIFDLSHFPEIRPPWTAATAPGSATSMAVRGEYLYAGFGEGGLATFHLIRK